jgi:phosphopentomutase
MNRVILIVLDSLGIGALNDAEKYGDAGADTFGHIVDNMQDIKIPNLQRLGFCNIDRAANGRLAIDNPQGSFGRLGEMSKGKDTITGHWEIAGILTETPFKTYPDGFPKTFMNRYEDAIGIKTLGNYAASGTEIIEELGAEHEKTGMPIIYTSADSVFQVAANVNIVPLEKLYYYCETAREMLVGEYACGRVIARPYDIVNGKRERTSGRKDYAVSPTDETVLDKIIKAGYEVYAVGKINDIFNGKGISTNVHTESNMDGVDKTIEAVKIDFEGLIFTNLVDFDSKYGHRRDPVGYGKAIEEFDLRLPEILEAMNKDDILMLCADHGNDPIHSGWDHTREYVPIVIYGDEIKNGVNIGTGKTFADIGATISDILSIGSLKIGRSFLSNVIE